MRDGRSLDEKLVPQGFVADFVWAARAVFSQPSVLLVTFALCCGQVLAVSVARHEHHVGLAALAGLVFFTVGLGWDGVERAFFQRRREGRPVRLPELLISAPSFIARFARLGFLVGLATCPLALGGVSLALMFSATGAPRLAVAASRIGSMAQLIAIDLVLTFATSALVFTTRSAWDALRIGLRMIRETWPRSALYVLCPPLALSTFNAIYRNHVSVAPWLVTTALLVLLALLTKGATAAFYLRERPASPDAVTVAEEAGFGNRQ
jgi:hypothetical protein